MAAMVPIYGNDKVSTYAGSGASLTQAITPAAGVARRVYAVIGWYGLSGAITYVRYDGRDMSLIATKDYGGANATVKVYEITIPDAETGAKNITAAWATNGRNEIIAFSFALADTASDPQVASVAYGGGAIGVTCTTDDVDTMIFIVNAISTGGGSPYPSMSDTTILVPAAQTYGPNLGVAFRDADAPNTSMSATWNGGSGTAKCAEIGFCINEKLPAGYPKVLVI